MDCRRVHPISYCSLFWFFRLDYNGQKKSSHCLAYAVYEDPVIYFKGKFKNFLLFNSPIGNWKLESIKCIIKRILNLFKWDISFECVSAKQMIIAFLSLKIFSVF